MKHPRLQAGSASFARGWATVAAVLLLVLPGLANTPVAARAAPAWPPEAWDHGDVAALSLAELVHLVAGVQPGTPQAASLAQQLERLDTLPADQKEAARIGLEGLARAAWHQERALAGLTPWQRFLVAGSDGVATPGADMRAALDAIDDGEVAQATAALAATASRLAAALPPAGQPALLAPAIARFLPGAATPGPAPAAPSTAADLARAIASLTGASVEPAALDALDAIPPQARQALSTILSALQDLQDPSRDAADGVLALAQRIDDAREVLRVWAALAAAQDLERARAAPTLRLPDPDADVPPLRLGLNSVRTGPLSPPPPLPASLAALAGALGIPLPPGAKEETARLQQALPDAQEQAVSQVLEQARRYIQANRAALALPVPPDLVGEPDLLSSWSRSLRDGDLPEPGSPEEQRLLSALPWMQAEAASAHALEDLLAAAEALVPAFTQAEEGGPAVAAEGEQAPCQGEAQLGRTFVLWSLLALDRCGDDGSAWTEPAVLTIDMAGDDVYTHQAGAPFPLVNPTTVPSLDGHLSPVQILLDLGGSDTYDAGDQPCSQGAACADLLSWNGESFGTDDVARLRPVSVLVDWDGDGAQATNAFTAGPRSQGFGGMDNTVLPALNPAGVTASGAVPGQAGRMYRPYGVLVERVGQDATLGSTYTAGDKSQGAAVGGGTTLTPDTAQSGVGLLLRLVGSGAASSSTFTAGDKSQGVNGGTSAVSVAAHPLLAALLNVAGRGATHQDTYQAGTGAQGAGFGAQSLSVFADVAGPGSRSDDRYVAASEARGFTPTTAQLQWSALFLDAVLPGADLAAEAALPEAVLPDPGSSPRPPDAGVDAGVRGRGGSSDDSYSALLPVPAGGPPGTLGHGHSTGFFVDVGGRDDYAGSPTARDDATWNHRSSLLPNAPLFPAGPNGFDTGQADDGDSDLLPPFVERLLHTAGLWGSPDDARDNTLPAQPRVLLDLGGHRPFLDEPYAFVLSLLGQTTYGPGFSAAVSLDLGLGRDGADTYLARVGAADGLLEPLNSTGRVRRVTDGLGLPAVGNLPSSPRPPSEPGVRLLSFTLDLAGDDDYRAAPRSQGFGRGHAAGILVDLEGNDRYEAPSFAQGVGLQGGIGLLADVGPPGDVNRFRAAAPSHGYGSAGLNWTGGLGVLVAAGKHNSFSDDPRVQDGSPQDGEDDPADGEGVSLNVAAGGNGAPQLLADSVPVGPVQAGQSVAFTAEATDPDGDDLVFCWALEVGTGQETAPERCVPVLSDGDPATVLRATLPYAWLDVRTDGSASPPVRERTFGGTLVVRDPGGRAASLALDEVVVANEPPTLVAPLRGPATVNAGQPRAFQAVVAPAPDLDPTTLSALFDWGDGTVVLEQSVSIDWLRPEQGGVPEPLPQADHPVEGLTGSVRVQNPLFSPGSALDGSDATFASFEFGGDSPWMHAAFDLAGPRLLNRTRLVASLGPDNPDDAILSLEALLSDGTLLPLGIVTVTQRFPAVDAFGFAVPVPDDPRIGVVSLQVRQLAPTGAALPSVGRVVQLHSLEGYGPGFLHSWPFAGPQSIRFAALDQYGGRTGTLPPLAAAPDAPAAAEGFEVTVDPPTGTVDPPFPLDYLQFGTRGPARQASVAASTFYPLVLATNTALAPATDVCIDWGDGTPATCQAVGDGGVLGFRHAWAPSDEPLLVRALVGPAGDPTAEQDLLRVHVEEQAIDLFQDSSAPQPGQGEAEAATFTAQPRLVPLAFLSFEEDRTWYSGTPYYLVVDGGGDDRHSGRVATSDLDPAPSGVSISPLGPRPSHPSLVVDLDGDDDYLSTLPETQGYASAGSVGFLFDAAGDDVYVAPARAQGAALNHGVGVLVDLGGDDRLNPVPPGHPDVLAGLADDPARPDPWLQRPAALMPDRVAALSDDPATPLLAEGTLLQGAAQEGIGLLVLRGGLDLLSAGERAQGYGSRSVPKLAGYALPEPDCWTYSIINAGVPPAPNVPPPFPGPGDPMAVFDPGQAGYLCMLGMHGLNSPGSGIPTPFPASTPGNTASFNAFISNNAPRYGPGLGAFLADGVTAAHAGGRAQASADPGGRALLADPSGVLLATARQRTQAYAESGHAALVAGGPLLASGVSQAQGWLDRDPGQNPESVRPSQGGNLPGPLGNGVAVEAPAAVLAMLGGGGLVCAQACGAGGNRIPEPGPQGDTLRQQLEAARGDRAPQVAWALGEEPALAGQAVRAKATITPAPEAADDPLEVAAFTLSRAWDAATGACGPGEPFVAPARTLSGLRPPGAQDLVLDASLAERLRDGPVRPMGCLDVHVFARHVRDGRPTSDWGLLTQTLVALPTLPVEALRTPTQPVLSGGPPATFQVVVPQPLAVARRPVLEAAILPEGSAEVPAGATVLSPVAWSDVPDGAVATFSWTPSGAPVQRLWLRARWDHAESAFGAWAATATPFLFDTQPPVVRTGTVLLPDGTLNLRRPVAVQGEAFDVGGVAQVQVRFVDERGPIFPGVPAQLLPLPDRTVLWQASVTVPAIDRFLGGTATVQVNAIDVGGFSSGWTTVGTVTLDGGGPKVTRLATLEEGAAASNRPFPILLSATFSDALQSACRPACTAGSGVAADSLAGLVVRVADRAAWPLVPVSQQTTGNVTTAVLRWDGEGRPQDGAHLLLLQASDATGNRRYQAVGSTGTRFMVDASAPEILQARLDGLKATRPGGSIPVAVQASDGAGESGIAAVRALLLDATGRSVASQTLPPAADEGWYSGVLQVPDEGSAVVGPVQVRVEVHDRAGNPDARLLQKLDFMAQRPAFREQAVTPRATSLAFRAVADRDVAFLAGTLTGAGAVHSSGEADHAAPTQAWSASVGYADSNGNDLRDAADPIVLHLGAGADGKLTPGDVFLTSSPKAEAFQAVQAGHALADSPFVFLTPLGAERFLDLDGDGRHGRADPLYLDLDGSGAPSPGDVRLTPFGLLPGGAVVQAADGDGGFPLHGLPTRPQACFADGDGDGRPDVGETLYLAFQAGCGAVAGDDLRLTPSGPLPGGRRVVPAYSGGPTGFEVLFSGLAPDTPYDATLRFLDAAGWVLEWKGTVRTAPVNQATLAVTPPADASLSGPVRIAGLATLAKAGPLTVSLHVDSPLVPPVDSLSASGVAAPFQLEWDPAGRSGPVLLHVLLDDGSSLVAQPVPLLLDNAPPGLSLHVVGSSADGAWYNSTVVVRPETADATGPVVTTFQDGDGPVLQAGELTLASNGLHRVRVTAFDGAVPPNAATALLEVKVDRSLPLLEAAVEPAGAVATSNRSVPLRVAAQDSLPGSGVQAYRVRAGSAWGDWSAAAPTQAALEEGPDGQRFIDIEVRDGAHNVQRITLETTLDRAPPLLAALRWVGHTPDGTPVLHVAARDALRDNATGRPAGIEAIRFADPATQAWGEWTPFDGSQAFPVVAALLEKGTVLLQVRDLAGNLGAPVRSPANTLDPTPQPPPAQEPQGPLSEALLAQAGFEPRHGTTQDLFVFSVQAFPVDGRLPDAVTLLLDGAPLPMQATGPTLAGGARLYTASASLDATRLGEPHLYSIVARYGAREVALAEAPGPLVTVAVDDPVQPAGSAGAKGAAGLPLFALLAALAAAAFALTRRKHP